ncbi:MAG TPA: hypothetical protein VIW80_01535 [Pyrinomonadaceae bacterium]|jgi:hypothetical protein
MTLARGSVLAWIKGINVVRGGCWQMLEVKEPTDVPLTHHLDELAAFEPTGYPFVSLYLDMRSDQHGRDNFDSFVRKEFAARGYRGRKSPSSKMRRCSPVLEADETLPSGTWR